MSATSKLENTRLTFTTNGTTVASRITASADTLTLVGNAAANVTVGGVANPSTAQQAATKSYADGLVTGAALTKVDDTNVTLTLGGTPATALLRAVSITAGWSGTLGVSRGGTGTSSVPTNGQLLIGNGTNYTLNTLSATNGLEITNGAGTSSVGFTSSITITYLIIGGGGGGAVGGGGGAGGFVTGTGTVTSSTTLTGIPGAGGAGGSTTSNGTNGGTTTLGGTGFGPFTATGGGGGVGASSASSGGSGGGGGFQGVSTAGTGTVGQGNNGGAGTGGAGSGGGGGGAGAVGAAGTATNGGTGGVGLSNSLTGTAVFYSGGGGGGGGSSAAGAGGNGGGGAGSRTAGGTAGTINTGGGGGGCGAGFTGGAGGRGFVVVKIPTSIYGGVTGAAVATTLGTDTIITYPDFGSVIITIPSTGVVIPNNLTVTGSLTVGNINSNIVSSGYMTAVQPYGFVYGTGSQTINNGSPTTVSAYWGTTTLVGGVTYLSGAYTIPVSGVYVITAMIPWPSNASGERVVDIMQNPGSVRLTRTEIGANTAGPTKMIVTMTIALTASVSIYITLYQDSGSNLLLDTAIPGNFCVTKVS